MRERRSLAGVAQVDVTPPAGTMLEGYHRTEPSSGVLERLYATILVLKVGGDDPIALLVIDHIGLSVAYTDPLRKRVGERLGVDKERVMACFSHTHSGPRATPGYVRSLSERVERAGGEAAARLRPARVGWGVGSVEAGVNRRPRGSDGRAFMGEAPDRPVDRRLGVLRVDGAEADPMAVLLWYGAHANVLEVARRFAGRPVFFGGYTGGWIGYLPTAEEHEAGGYEVELAPVVHGHRSGWLSSALPQTANDVATSAVESISET